MWIKKERLQYRWLTKVSAAYVSNTHSWAQQGSIHTLQPNAGNIYGYTALLKINWEWGKINCPWGKSKEFFGSLQILYLT